MRDCQRYPEKLSFASGAQTTPLYDLDLIYLLGIAQGKMYFLGLTRGLSWDYVLAEVSKDGSSWTVLERISPEAGMGLCKKDDGGYQPEECWRRVSLQRVGMTDEMRWEDWGLSWKIAPKSCPDLGTK